MRSDELDDRLRMAGKPDEATVERVVAAALGTRPAGGAPVVPSRLAWSPVFSLVTVGLVAAIAGGVWWCARIPTNSSLGVYRIEAARPSSSESGLETGRAANGVYTVTAIPTAPRRVFRVTTGDGTAWILSSDAGDERTPTGHGLVLSGRDRQ
jgi:hypothetical protein